MQLKVYKDGGCCSAPHMTLEVPADLRVEDKALLVGLSTYYFPFKHPRPVQKEK